MINGRGLETDQYLAARCGRALIKGSYEDVIRYRVSEALRRVDSGNYFKTKPIFIEAQEMADIERMYLNKYSKCVEKTSQFSYYPVVGS